MQNDRQFSDPTNFIHPFYFLPRSCSNRKKTICSAEQRSGVAMKRSRFIVLLLLLTATGLLAGGLIARAKSPNETSQDLRQLALKKISPWVMAKTTDGQEAEFLVMLGEQADLSLADRLQTKEEKGRYVFNA
ncbi:MAG: hypothetical protein KA368_21515, partial [Acidobacteria bacterium]|nr:hypothetical protein [Acidobacteriota bacterium]